MVVRRPLMKFCHKGARKGGGARLIINEQPKTYSDKVYPQIPYMIREKQARLKVPAHFGNNPSGQLVGLAAKVTRVIRDERVVFQSYNTATTVRPHVDRLIVEAMRYGDKHRPTMNLANFWLLDKSLIHKLFKVLVPRYENYATAFTAIHHLGHDYSHAGKTMTELKEERVIQSYSTSGRAILELRGNDLPPIVRPQLNRPGLLTNVLINSATVSSKTGRITDDKG